MNNIEKLKTQFEDLLLVNSNLLLFTDNLKYYLKKLIKYFNYKFNNKVDSIFLREYYKNYIPDKEHDNYFYHCYEVYSFELIFKNSINNFNTNNLTILLQINFYTNHGSYSHIFENKFEMYNDRVSIAIPSDRKKLCGAGSILKISPKTKLSEYNKMIKNFYKTFRQNIFKMLNGYFEGEYYKLKEYPQTIDRDRLKSLIDYWKCIV